MRKIQTREEIEKKKKRNNIIIGAILVGIMALSTIGYSFLSNEKTDSSQKAIYNSITFYKYGELWQTTIGETNFFFQYLPQEIENISIMGSFDLSSYTNKPLYFVNYNPAATEILQNLNNYIQRYQEACLNMTNSQTDKNCADWPLKNCDEDNLIIFNLNESQTYVKQEGGCIYLSGEFIKASDAFLYRLLKIVN